jgi:hypothetical protein
MQLKLNRLIENSRFNYEAASKESLCNDEDNILIDDNTLIFKLEGKMAFISKNKIGFPDIFDKSEVERLIGKIKDIFKTAESL